MNLDLLQQPAAVIAAIGSLAVTIGIGWWAGRRVQSAADFFIAGQRLSLLVTAIAAMAASFSGFVFLGGPGLTYRIGIASLFINLPVSFTAALMCWVLAKRLRLLAQHHEVYTIPDALAVRFSSRTPAGLAAVAIIFGSCGYLAAQLLALGRLLEAIFGIRRWAGDGSLSIAIALGLLVVVFYSVAGGMLAGVYTDLFQGSLMMVSAVAVFWYALSAGGGTTAILSTIAQSDQFGADFLNPFGRVPLVTGLGFFFLFSIGTLGQPHVLHKFYMIRDRNQLKWMPFLLAGSQTVCLLIWLGIGLAVPALVVQGKLPPLAHPDDAAPLFLLHFTPQLLTGIVMAGIVAAIMSTADSLLNIGAAALVRDLPRALGRSRQNELALGRLAVILIALLAAVTAYLYDDLIALLGTLAFGTFAAALAPALALSLNDRRISSTAVSASIGTGLIGNLGLEFLSQQTLFSWLPGGPLLPGALPSACALAASFVVLILVNWFCVAEPMSPAAEEALG